MTEEEKKKKLREIRERSIQKYDEAWKKLAKI